MKKIYLIYDYDTVSEWPCIYHICNTLEEVKEVYKQDLFDFCAQGPDDYHSFQCQAVLVSDEELVLLKEWQKGNESELGEELLKVLYTELDRGINSIFWTDGCSDNHNVFINYMEEKHPDVSDGSDEWSDLEDEFFNDEDLYRAELKKYIDKEYKL